MPVWEGVVCAFFMCSTSLIVVVTEYIAAVVVLQGVCIPIHLWVFLTSSYLQLFRVVGKMIWVEKTTSHFALNMWWLEGKLENANLCNARIVMLLMTLPVLPSCYISPHISVSGCPIKTTPALVMLMWCEVVKSPWVTDTALKQETWGAVRKTCAIVLSSATIAGVQRLICSNFSLQLKLAWYYAKP